MSRLLAFGCSNTYGSGLKDIWNGSIKYLGEPASNLAWPSLIAQKINRTCLNFAIPGNSNKAIWHNAVSTSYEKDDVVFVCWTHNNRSCIFEGNLYNNVPIDDCGKINFGTWNKDKKTNFYYKEIYNDFDAAVDTNLRIDHLNNFFKNINIKCFHLLVDEKELYRFNFNRAELLKPCISKFKSKYALAEDNLHPNEEAHKDFAETIYNKIKEIL